MRVLDEGRERLQTNPQRPFPRGTTEDCGRTTFFRAVHPTAERIRRSHTLPTFCLKARSKPSSDSAPTAESQTPRSLRPRRRSADSEGLSKSNLRNQSARSPPLARGGDSRLRRPAWGALNAGSQGEFQCRRTERETPHPR